ncbi:MAG: hypothetical protein JXR64_05010 [Spirochaetales bacterium]|nr:hypothetical protein [Spirochaetales bacterium]
MLKALDKIKIQLFVLLIVIVAYILNVSGFLPSTSEMILKLNDLFLEYGLPIVALSSFLEHIVGVNVYFPGSIVIVTAMTLAAGNLSFAITIFLAEVIPAILAYIFNYFVTYFAVKKDTSTNIYSEKKFYKYLILYFSTLWHPHFGAVTCIQSAKEKMPIKTFLLLLIPFAFFWDLCWGILIYNFGYFFKTNADKLFPIFVLYIIIWILIDLLKINDDQIDNLK